MIRLHLIGEGQTEETFVRDVLAPHLAAYAVFADVRCIDTSRRRGHRGGIGRHYAPIRRDIQRWLAGSRIWSGWRPICLDARRTRPHVRRVHLLS